MKTYKVTLYRMVKFEKVISADDEKSAKSFLNMDIRLGFQKSERIADDYKIEEVK